MSELSNAISTEEGHEAFIQGVLKTAQECMKADGHVAPLAILFGTINPESGENHHCIHYVDLRQAFKNKDESSVLLKTLAEKTRAICMAFISEAWHVRTSDPTRVERMVDLEFHPDRTEVVMANFEHTKFGMRHYIAEIQETEGKRCMSDFKQAHPQQATGRFVRLLPEFRSN